MRVRYRDTTDEQTFRGRVRWGGNDDPSEHLEQGSVYVVDEVEEHTWHTKYHINGRRFNSVHFEVVEEEE